MKINIFVQLLTKSVALLVPTLVFPPHLMSVLCPSYLESFSSPNSVRFIQQTSLTVSTGALAKHCAHLFSFFQCDIRLQH